MIGTVSSIIGIGSTLQSLVKTAVTADDWSDFLNPDNDMAALGAQLSTEMQGHFTRELRLDLADGLSQADRALNKLSLLGDRTVDESEFQRAIDDAARALGTLTAKAEVVFTDPTSTPEEVELAVGALTHAVNAQLTISGTLQSGLIEDGGYRRADVQLGLERAAQVLDKAEGAFVDGLDISVSMQVDWVETMANSFGPAGWMMALWHLIDPPEPTVGSYTLTVGRVEGVNLGSVLNDVFGAGTWSTRPDWDGKAVFEIRAGNREATIEDGLGNEIGIPLNDPSQAYRISTYIKGEIADRALEASSLGASGGELDSFVQELQGMTGGAHWVDPLDGGHTHSGTAQDDYINGLDGDDRLFGGDGDDYIVGGEGHDLIDGGNGIDQMFGGAGNDTYRANHGDRVIEDADGGIDTVESVFGYRLEANVENLKLTGTVFWTTHGAGNGLDNRLDGSRSDNVLVGGGGDDILDGHEGRDVLIGGEGEDSFVFSNLAQASPMNLLSFFGFGLAGAGGVDRIEDFTAGEDTIVFDSSVFTALADGITEGNIARNQAQDADDHLILKGDGLLYDADGLGGTDAIHIADVHSDTGLALELSASDFGIF